MSNSVALFPQAANKGKCEKDEINRKRSLVYEPCWLDAAWVYKKGHQTCVPQDVEQRMCQRWKPCLSSVYKPNFNRAQSCNMALKKHFVRLDWLGTARLLWDLLHETGKNSERHDLSSFSVQILVYLNETGQKNKLGQVLDIIFGLAETRMSSYCSYLGLAKNFLHVKTKSCQIDC